MFVTELLTAQKTRLTASSHNTLLTLCSASSSTHTDQHRDAFAVFSAFPSPTLHFSALLLRNQYRCTLDIFDSAISFLHTYLFVCLIFIIRHGFSDDNLELEFQLSSSVLHGMRSSYPHYCSCVVLMVQAAWWVAGHWRGIDSSAIWSQTGTVTSDLWYKLLINIGQSAQMPHNK